MSPVVTTAGKTRMYSNEPRPKIYSSSTIAMYWALETQAEQTAHAVTIRPNEQTLEALLDAKLGTNLTEYDTVKDFFDSLDEA